MAIFDRKDFKYLDNIGLKPMLQARVSQLKVGQDLMHRPNFLQSKTKDGRERGLTAGKLRLTRHRGLKLIKLVTDIAVVNTLLQCNDISLNPGRNNRGLICPICDKTIRRFQANAQCSICDLYIHLSCLGSEFEQSKHCSLSSVPVLSSNNSVGRTFPLLPDLANLVTNRGLKIVHQNIQSLTKKIDELRLICSSVQAGIHLMTLSETWLNEQISDSEISIEGYKIFRLDRADRGGGVAVYAKSE